MAGEKNNRMCTSFIERSHHSSMRKEMSFFGTMSLDDNSDFVRNNRSACNSPKFLRTQSSSGIFVSPRKSRSVTRFLGGLISTSSTSTNSTQSTNIGDVYASSASIRDKIINCSSLSNLSRLMSASARISTTGINRSELSVLRRNVDHVIDENCEIRHSLSDIDKRHQDNKMASAKLLEICGAATNNNNQRSSNRMKRLRSLQSRRRSISCDSWEIEKENKRYVLQFSSNKHNKNIFCPFLWINSFFSFCVLKWVYWTHHLHLLLYVLDCNVILYGLNDPLDTVWNRFILNPFDMIGMFHFTMKCSILRKLYQHIPIKRGSFFEYLPPNAAYVFSSKLPNWKCSTRKLINEHIQLVACKFPKSRTYIVSTDIYNMLQVMQRLSSVTFSNVEAYSIERFSGLNETSHWMNMLCG